LGSWKFVVLEGGNVAAGNRKERKMLAEFTWGEFLVAMALLNAVWYAMVILVLYRKELSGVLGNLGGRRDVGRERKTPANSPVSNTSGGGRAAEVAGELAGEKSGGQVQPGSLMGASRLPDGVEVISSSQVAFFGGSADGKYELVGLVADVVQELKMIFSELEKKDLGKPEFFGRVAAINEEYGPLSGHPNLGAINEFIQTSAPFAISTEELDNLWY
jgi:hypothetical protein